MHCPKNCTGYHASFCDAATCKDNIAISFFLPCHLPAGAPSKHAKVSLTLYMKGTCKTAYGGFFSQEGGTESPFHVRRDALLLAAHELGGRPGHNSKRGVSVTTAAGKDFLSKLEPFQKSKLNEWEDTAQAIGTLKQDIELRMVEIYEQLLEWPQSPLAPLQGDM
jgi:hypothetical protein